MCIVSLLGKLNTLMLLNYFCFQSFCSVNYFARCTSSFLLYGPVKMQTREDLSGVEFLEMQKSPFPVSVKTGIQSASFLL